MTNLFLYHLVSDRYNLFVPRRIIQILSMVGLMSGKVGIILERTNNTGDDLVCHQMLNDCIVVQQYQRLHNVAQFV